MARNYPKTVGATSVIPFDNPVTTMPPKVIAGAYTFTKSTTGAQVGYGAIVRVTADGSNVPDLSAFKKIGTGSYDNTNGVVNQLWFIYDGVDYCVAITQPVAITGGGGGGGDTTPPSALSVTVEDAEPNKVLIAYGETLDSGSVPATSAYTITVNGSSRTISSVSITGSNVKVTFGGAAVASGDTITLNYVVPGANPVQDVAGNNAAALTGVTVDNNVAGGGTLVLDGITVGRAYSLIKLKTAYAGPCIRVQRASDSTEQDIGFDGSGVVDIAAFNTFVSGTTGKIVKWYDQSGNAQHALQTIVAAAPTLSSAGLSSKPSLTFSGSSQYMTFPEVLSGPGNKSAFVVCKNSETGSGLAKSILSQSALGGPTGAWFALQVRNSGANGYPYFAGYSADLTDSNSPSTSPILGAMLYNGTSGFLRRNGAQVATSALSLDTTASNPEIAADVNGTCFMGEISTVILSASYISGSSLSQIESRLNTYYAIY